MSMTGSLPHYVLYSMRQWTTLSNSFKTLIGSHTLMAKLDLKRTYMYRLVPIHPEDHPQCSRYKLKSKLGLSGCNECAPSKLLHN